ncbi:MAG TPA: class I SAM-dependent methyltransferase, partial [Bryobacteraceae bacterium]|nr:class I SAM-dependent methyltransferase [Bryobacteraceae bacterium]
QVARLSKLGWYHSIELPDGGVIEGHQSLEQLRKRIHQFPIPADLTGKRALDIGAWDGWFSFEMERRGAEVLAVDSTKNTRLLEAKRLLGSGVQHHVADICRLTAKDVGSFDIVLFLGVLYHVKHPILALENVCGMCRGIACIESFVTESDPAAIPSMEFYETTELRGQLDNWVGPNAACLMAFCRTAGFARVNFESTLGERAHVTGYRDWLAGQGNGPAPEVVCIENSATHDHTFSATADDYLTFYFRSPREAGGPAEGHQTGGVRPDPVIELPAQFGRFVELHRRDGGGVGFRYEGFDARHAAAHTADVFERQNRVLDVVEHAEKQHDIERANVLRGEPADVGDMVLDARSEETLRFEKTGVLRRIDGQHFGSPALHFKAEPAVPGADVEYSFACEIGGNRKLMEAFTQLFERLMPFDHAAIGQFDAVIPAEF